MMWHNDVNGAPKNRALTVELVDTVSFHVRSVGNLTDGGQLFSLLFGQPHSAIRAALQSSKGKLPKNVENCLGQPLPMEENLLAF